MMLSLLLLTSLSQANEHSDNGSGAMVLHLASGDVDALALDAHMDVHVQGMLADMSLKQSFRNNTNQWVEGSYLFPLPPDAAVRGLQITVGERVIQGDIQPREQAKVAYEKASQAGNIASLIDQQRPNLFTIKVANIAPQSLIEVTLDIMLPVQLFAQQRQLNLPTTLTPRYIDTASDNAAALASPFVTANESRGPRLDVTLTISPLIDLSSVSSQTHTLQTDGDRVRIENTPMDRDLKLSWPAHYGTEPSVHAFVSVHDNQKYVQLLVHPPARSGDVKATPRELVLVVDKSGSMAGVSMRAAIEALNYAIDELSPEDYLNIIAFDDNEYPLFSQSRQATDQNKHEARRFVDRLSADGGTEMRDALNLALGTKSHDDIELPSTMSHNPAQRLRQIVFMTDGSVGYEDELLASIKSHLHHSRLFTIGIGPSPNTWFLEKSAEAGRGIFVSIQDEHDVAQSITRLLSELARPIITDIAVQYPNGHGEMYPRPVPDLYAERPGLWLSKISDSVHDIVITGKQDGARWRKTVSLPLEQAQPTSALSSSAPAIAMQWTRRKIDSLMDEQRYSSDPDLNRSEITALAMEVGLLTPYTSFVAIETEPTRPAQMGSTEHSVANLIPQGNEMILIGVPQGAAGIDTLTWLSVILASCGLILLGLARGLHRAPCTAT